MTSEKPSAEKKDAFAASGFFALRTALLPLSGFLRWGEAADGAANGPADRAVLRERLRGLVSRPEIREAVFVASPSLDQGIEKWLREPDSKDGRHAEASLVRYFARMAGRSTPFGLFSGCSVGSIGETTRLGVASLAQYRRHTRLDMDYLFALAEKLASDPAIQAKLLYRPNSSLYRSAGRLRYAEARMQEKLRSYHLVGVEPSDYLLATLERAGGGARLADLAAALTSEEISSEEAAGFVDELVRSQILVPELSHGTTGPEPIHELIATLRTIAGAAPAASVLEQVRRDLAEIDASPLGLPQSRYRAIAEKLKALPAEVEISRLFQIDMVKPAPGASLGKSVVEEIAKGIELLHRCAPASAEDAISQFAREFSERYEGREVSLVEVLDEEVGIGFQRSNAPSAEASPLLEGIALPAVFAPGGAGGADGTRWTAREAHLLRRLQDATAAGASEIELGEKDLEALASPYAKPLPDAFAAMCVLAARSDEAFEKGEYRIHMKSCGGPSGANLLGRFCHGDAALTDFVRAHVREEEALEPDTIFAEIVHLPEGRLGNVLLRPVLREHEIPFLARAAVATEKQIPITDLLVSVVRGEVILRSKRLGKRILPRLTSAHGYFNPGNLGLYKFLGALQWQGRAGGVSWSWGVLESAPFLPRVTSGKLVLARARWSVAPAEWEPIEKAKGEERVRLVQEWRLGRKLPRVAVLADYDNELPVDFENPLSVEAFIDGLKKRTSFALKEMPPGPEELSASGPEGRFVSEIVVPFVRKREASKEEKPKRMPVATSSAVKRSFLPGSQWLYAKLYTGTATADQILREIVRPLAQRALESDAADRWFFIRYGDPQWHLRVRFHGDPGKLQAVLPWLEEAAAVLLSDGRLWKLQLDTYEREIERYGGEAGTALAEQLFHADSECTLSILDLIQGDELADARWRLAIYGIDALLNDFGLDLKAKHKLLQTIADSHRQEFRVTGGFSKGQFGDRFRKERKALESMLDPTKAAEHPLAPAFEIFRHRSTALAPIVAALRDAEKEGRLTATIEELLPSYIHMNANRLLRSAARAQEVVIYDFLERLYESKLARLRGKSGDE